MKNLEWKAELRDPNLARLLCKKIGAERVARIHQTDTFFNVARGRLKKREASVLDDAGREASSEPVEYIFYERPDTVRPRVSAYHILTEDELAARYGASPLPEWIVVTKTRELYMHESVRLHIDDVRGLGWHLEFEIVLGESASMDDADRRAGQLRATFAPALGEPVASSYADLLAQTKSIDPGAGS